MNAEMIHRVLLYMTDPFVRTCPVRAPGGALDNQSAAFSFLVPALVAAWLLPRRGGGRPAMRAVQASHPRVVLRPAGCWPGGMDRLALEMVGWLLTLIRVGDVPEDEGAGNGGARPVA